MAQRSQTCRQPLEIQIPSHVDGTLIECRIDHPKEVGATFGAVFAHPYGPLGGSFDDRVVGIVKEELLSAGAAVATFNFRGVGRSAGKASWSGEPEVEDFESVVLFLRAHLTHLRRSPDARPKLRIVLGGYSFGSLVASRVRQWTLTAPLTGKDVSKHINSISAAAQRHTSTQYSDNARKQDVDVSQDTSEVAITFSYLLVSPIPGFVGRILTPTSRFGLFGSQWDNESMSSCPSLAIFGDSDCFSSAKKLRSWARELQKKPDSLFRSAEVKDAGHFWVEANATRDLQEILRTRLVRLKDLKPRSSVQTGKAQVDKSPG